MNKHRQAAPMVVPPLPLGSSTQRGWLGPWKEHKGTWPGLAQLQHCMFAIPLSLSSSQHSWVSHQHSCLVLGSFLPNRPWTPGLHNPPPPTSACRYNSMREKCTFSFWAFFRESISLSDPLLLNSFLMKCYDCTPLYKECVWLQVINCTLEEPNNRLSYLKYFMANIIFFSLISRAAME